MNPEGLESVPCVAAGNLMASRLLGFEISSCYRLIPQYLPECPNTNKVRFGKGSARFLLGAISVAPGIA